MSSNAATSNESTRAPDAAAPPRRYNHWTYKAALGAMVAGYYSVEFITNNVIPLTARHFTDSAFFIAAIVALNRLFGFIVQPYVSWKSDRIRTRFGRRRFFLLIGIPGTLVSLLAVGAFPHVVPPQYHHTAMVLGLFFVANVALQAFVDMNWGSHEPLYADTFKHRMLGRAVAYRSWAINIVTLFMSGWALKQADRNEYYVYLCSAACLIVSLLIVIFIVREEERPPPPRNEPYNPLSHLSLIVRNGDYFKIAAIGGLGIMGNAAFMLYLSLLATRTLGLTKAEYGLTLFLGPIISFLVSFPAGYLVDRVGPKPVMATGFLLFAANSAAMGFWVHDFRSLLLLLSIYAAALNLVSLPLTSMIFQYAAPDERGRVYGLFQFTRGFSAFVFSLAIGTAVQFSHSRDAVPLYSDDLKDAPALERTLRERSTPLAAYLHSGLSSETRASLAALEHAQTPSAKTAREHLVRELNQRIAAAPLSDAALLKDVRLSGRAQDLLRNTPTGREARIVLNRTLLHDAFPEYFSKSVDFRIGYKIDIFIALAACVLTLSTRKGKYAET